MTTAPDLDPYLLPLPTPDTAVVPEHLLVAMHAHLNSRFSDPTWSLAPIIGNPSAHKLRIHWSTCPPGFEDELRLAAWNLINGQLRPSYLRERAVRLRARLGAGAILATVSRWWHLALWLEAHGIDRLGGCSSTVLHEYGLHLRDSRTRDHCEKIFGAVTRLWAFDQLSAHPTGIGRPPWDEFGADDFLPPATSTGGENATEPLSAATMGPLLVWAIRMVDDFADDILAGWAETRRLTAAAQGPPRPGASKALHALLDPLIQAQAPLPATWHQGRTSLARTYISALTGASKSQVDRFAARHDLVAAVRERPGLCPLAAPITGTIASKSWRQALDFYETATLMRHLGTAAFVVCAYLTGMRPAEILALRSGCCPDPEPGPDGTMGRHLICGHEFKTATDEDGNHLASGREREVPWVAITPVVNAIRVLERMVPPGHLLFESDSHWWHGHRPGTGSLNANALRARIEDFITWANAEAASLQLPHETIPPDPHGEVGVERFRRSLAWHIARRPGGLVALAIQYGHMKTLISEGYASRSRHGIHDLIDVETARAVADTVAELHQDLEAGVGISGPAARRAIKAASAAPRFAGTVITATTARRLLANEDAMIFDNPEALLLCHYKRDQALCHRDGTRTTPSLDRCRPDCGNIVRTDAHALQLRQRAEHLDQQATHTPGPVGDRLRATADSLRDIATTHDRTRITTQEPGR